MTVCSFLTAVDSGDSGGKRRKAGKSISVNINVNSQSKLTSLEHMLASS